MKCSYCGLENKEGAKFCSGCGAGLSDTPQVNNLQNSNVQVENKKNNKNKVPIIISLIIVAVLIVVVVILLSGNSNKSNSGEDSSGSNNENINNTTENSINNGPVNETSQEKYERQIANLSEEIYCGLEEYNKGCIIYVTNNNSETVNVVFDNITFYDENKKIIAASAGPKYSNGLGSGKTGYIPLTNMKTLDHYDSYEIKYSLKTHFESTDVRDDIEIEGTDNKEKQQIDLVAKNNSKETIGEIRAFVFFYKNDKLIAVDFTNVQEDIDGNLVPKTKKGKSIINSGDTVYGYVSYPDADYLRNKLDFDRFEVKIGEAYYSVDLRK